MEIQAVVAKAMTSCQRCYKRKKKCDRTLPQCENCRAAEVACSFLVDDCQNGTYPVAFVRGLETRIQELEEKLAFLSATAGDVPIQRQLSTENASHSTPPPLEHANQGMSSRTRLTISEAESRAPTITMAEELRILTLEATAERHFGATSGVSFANLTQAILKRLTPDRADFVFRKDQRDDTTVEIDWDSSPELFNPSLVNITTILGFDSSLFGPLPLSHIVEPVGSLVDLTLPGRSRTDELVSFYFAHSHTLYPILNYNSFLADVDSIYEDSMNLDTLVLFRFWIVLAISHSSYCSISLAEESEALLYYNKALEYSETACESGDMAALEITTLQVSFSFFNQLGPNTWFLIGMAARLAIGLGLHTAAAYKNLPFDVANMRKRLFFSIYMMDRVASMALGRPFALQDDDIEIEPFAEADDKDINAYGVLNQESLETPMMAVPCHILKLRRIASKISRHVYGNPTAIRENMPRREQIVFNLHKELIEWRRSTPFPLPEIHPRVPHLSSNWYDFNYFTHVSLLYRPSPLYPTLVPANVRKLADAASMSIRQAHIMHCQERFAYNWLNLLALFTAALSLIYASTVQPDELVVYLQHNQVINNLELVLQLFDRLYIKFPGARNTQVILTRVIRRYKDICGLDTAGQIVM
ncbi:hypothetical protein PFICI_13068 [Pestalotiopsis fici W106-1]|uniref:Zn(2)-C6 fungal-type domain-containing protein n=1 Tax=Pestalotiopsis fici (strain W106-1 / CGMCC3.15140) TaxID=1229662 RepID=W3WLE1_PESFW|nr:uncharacterized protein PFICI_13068 [Pestalotiopsis fici W106-1]ETS74584.1 hypothetical protein PFICI_13068 [Pestalotiopsis fici W106-1]